MRKWSYISDYGAKWNLAPPHCPSFRLAPGFCSGVFFVKGGAHYGVQDMNAPTYSDAHLRQILQATKSIAVVGISKKTVRPSWFVGNYMHRKGYRIIPVNPGFAGEPLFGTTAAASLSDIPQDLGEVHMVDIFRRSDQVLPIAEEAIEALLPRGLKTIWMQIGVINHEAAAVAEAAGLTVIMNKCPKMEYQRLIGELSWGGVNSGRISSKL